MHKLPFTIHACLNRFGVRLIRMKLSIAMTLVAMKVRSPFYVSTSVEMIASWWHQLRMDLWPYVLIQNSVLVLLSFYHRFIESLISVLLCH